MAVLLPLLVARASLVTVTATGASLVGLPASVGSLLVHAALGLVIAVALPRIQQRADHRIWLVSGVVLSAMVVGALLGQHSGSYYGSVIVDLLIGLGWMLTAFVTRDYGLSRHYLHRVGLVILLAAGINLWRVSTGSVESASYSQFIAYSALPAVLIFIDAAFDRRAALNGLLALLAGLVMLSAGARGPLVVAAIFAAGRIVLKARASTKATVLVATVGVAATAWMWRVFESALGVLHDFLTRVGLSTRVTGRLLNGTLFEDRARRSLVEHSLDLIAEHPFTGIGMSNDRPILAGRMGAAVDSEALGWYPHNLVLELWVQFGIVLGTFLTLLLLVAVLRAVFASSDSQRGPLVLFFVGIGLLPLLFSASYLSWPPFFGLVGLCLPRDAIRQLPAGGVAS